MNVVEWSGLVASLVAIASAAIVFGRWLAPRMTKAYKDYCLSRLPLKERLIRQGIEPSSAERAITRGLTDEDVKWNIRLNRPLNWKETQHPAEELRRRADYQRKHQR